MSTTSLSALQMAAGDPRLEGAVRRSRKLLHRRALVGAAASAVPVPGLDWLVDAALLSRLIPEINAQFGLSATQLDKLSPNKREHVQKAVAAVGSMLIGKFITRDLVVKAAQHAGVRLTTKQVAKYVPLAGQAISAVMGYTALRYLGEEHLKDCVRVAQAVQHLLPAPEPLPITMAMRTA
ncbi:hypothetical protein BH11PSE7_BH11PSE7_37860 [soil metagenome]